MDGQRRFSLLCTNVVGDKYALTFINCDTVCDGGFSAYFKIGMMQAFVVEFTKVFFFVDPNDLFRTTVGVRLTDCILCGCDVTRSVSKMTEIERRGGKRWDKPKKAEKSRDCGGGKF